MNNLLVATLAAAQLQSATYSRHTFVTDILGGGGALRLGGDGGGEGGCFLREGPVQRSLIRADILLVSEKRCVTQARVKLATAS